MKTLNVKLGDIQGTEIDADDVAPLNEKDIEKANQQELDEDTGLPVGMIAKENLKASAKAKLVAGTPLTEEEANTIVL